VVVVVVVVVVREKGEGKGFRCFAVFSFLPQVLTVICSVDVK